jgi:hypothetical protein
MYYCSLCSLHFNTSLDYANHIKEVHIHRNVSTTSFVRCSICNVSLANPTALNIHQQIIHHIVDGQQAFKLKLPALGGILGEYVLSTHKDNGDPLEFFNNHYHEFKYLLEECMSIMLRLKYQISLTVMFKKLKHVDDDCSAPQYSYLPSYFCSCMELVMHRDAIELSYRCAIDKICSSIDAFIKKGSGWTIDKLGEPQIKVCKYNPN